MQKCRACRGPRDQWEGNVLGQNPCGRLGYVALDATGRQGNQTGCVNTAKDRAMTSWLTESCFLPLQLVSHFLKFLLKSLVIFWCFRNKIFGLHTLMLCKNRT